MMYAIMSRDLSGIKLSDFNACEYYESKRDYHINPKYTSYGDVLVKMKRVKSGIKLSARLKWRGYTPWKPEISARFGEFRFGWLFLSFVAHFEYIDLPDVVVKDHLGEYLKSNS